MTRLETLVRHALREMGDEVPSGGSPIGPTRRLVRRRQVRTIAFSLGTAVAVVAAGTFGLRSITSGRVREPVIRRPVAPEPARCVDGWSAAPISVAGGGAFQLAAISGSSPADLWAVGSTVTGPAERRPLVEHWDGRRWTASEGARTGTGVADPAEFGGALTGVQALGPDDVWAAGWRDVGGSTPEPLVEHWDGRSWRRVSPPPSTSGRGGVPVAFTRLVVPGPDDVWLLGERSPVVGGESITRSVLEHWDGTGWNEISVPLTVAPSVGTEAIADVAVGPDGSVWLAGSRWKGFGEAEVARGGVVLRLQTIKWTRLPAPPGPGGVARIVPAADGTAWAIGAPVVGQPVVAERPTVLFRWDGAAWHRASSFEGDETPSGIVSAAGGGVWAAGARRGGVPFARRWDGRRWRDLDLGPALGREVVAPVLGLTTEGTPVAVETDAGRPGTARNLLWVRCP